MELRTVLSVLKKYWLLPALGVVIGALGGFALAYANALMSASGSSYTATVRSQVTGVHLTPQLSADIDYRINGAIALGLSDAEVSRIISETGVDPGGKGPDDDQEAFWGAVAVTRLDGPGIQVAATFDSADAAQQVADRVLAAYEPRLLAAFSDTPGVASGNSVRLVRENTVVSTGMRSRTGLGAIAGLLVGLAAVAVVYFRRRPVLTEQEVEAIADLPVVANLSAVLKPRAAQGAPVSDKLGLLATKLALATDVALRFIVWGSTSSADFASTSSVARAFAAVSGHEVWVLSENERPDALAGGDSTAPAGSPAPASKSLTGWTPGTMSSAAVRHAIAGALPETQTVVAVTDLKTPLGLAAMKAADASLIVVALGHTSVTDFTDAIVDLKQAGAIPAGVVLV